MKMKVNTSLELPVPLDILLTPENYSKDRVVNILKDSNHSYFHTVEIDEERDIISYNEGGFFINFLSQNVVSVQTYDRLKDNINNADLINLSKVIGANYFLIDAIIDDQRQSQSPRIGIVSRTQFSLRGGISELNLVESTKLFTSEYLAMRSMYLEQYLYIYDIEDFNNDY